MGEEGVYLHSRHDQQQSRWGLKLCFAGLGRFDGVVLFVACRIVLMVTVHRDQGISGAKGREVTRIGDLLKGVARRRSNVRGHRREGDVPVVARLDRLARVGRSL